MKFLPIVPMMLLLVQGVAGVDADAENANTGTTNLRALKSTKAKKGPPKGPKSTSTNKCPKSIGKLSVDSVPLNTDTSYRPELVDPDYWHPKSQNFEIIDWEKWDAVQCVVPKVLDPPQRSQLYVPNTRQVEDEMDWWHRSKLNFPGTDAWLASGKPNHGLVSDETMDLFSNILGPHPNSSVVPESLRNKLLWMDLNDHAEVLVSFNRWAWRSQTDGDGRPIGVGNMLTDFTNSPNVGGKKMSDASGYMNVQQSPDKKWFKIAVIFPQRLGPPTSPNSFVAWINMYVVQEGEVYTDRDGNVLTYVQPGDLLRVSYAPLDAYACDLDSFNLMYFPRTVAVLDEETGKITPNCPHYEALIDSVTMQPSKDLELKTFGFTNATDLTLQERWDFQTSYVSDIQMYSSAPTPPFGDDLENL